MATEILQVLGKFGGAKSWNDLEDRPFYTDADGTVHKLPEEYLPDSAWKDNDIFDLSEQLSVTSVLSSALNGNPYSFEYDTTAMREQLRKGPIKIKYKELFNTLTTYVFSNFDEPAGDSEDCDLVTLVTHSSFDTDPYILSLRIYDGRIDCYYKTALPIVVANDNGKFLQVVDGAWAAVALADVSKEGA